MLQEQSKPRQFCKPPLPFPPRVLEELSSLFFQVTAQDVGRERARRIVFQAEPASLRHPPCASSPAAPLPHEPLARDGKERHVGCTALGTPGILPQPQPMLQGWRSPLQEGWGRCQRGAGHHSLPQGTAWPPAPTPAGTRCSPRLVSLRTGSKRRGDSTAVRGGTQEQQSPQRQMQTPRLPPFFLR